MSTPDHFIKWLPTGPGICAAMLLDDPELDAPVWAELLSSAEYAGYSDKKSLKVARNWLLSRLAAKAAGSRLWEVPMEALEVRRAESGQPDLWLLKAGNGDEIPEKMGHLSISHTINAAMAVAGNFPVGVDVERCGRVIREPVANWAFTEKEREFASGCQTGISPYLAMWCAKEAGAKAWGKALLNHLDVVRIVKADWDRDRLEVGWEGLEDRRAEVRLVLWEDFLVALAGPPGSDLGPF